MSSLSVAAVALALACSAPGARAAQQSSPGPGTDQQTIGRTSAAEVQVAGAAARHGAEMLLGNGSTITAGAKQVKISLSRGGQILLCSTTSLHLSKDKSIADPQTTALMMSLDHGSLEAHYTVDKYSDVLLTPDLRILISGPGQANLSIRVNNEGDTCVDNHGANAPYVTVSSQLDGGAYRVQPDQRVTFEHGGLKEMVDSEKEPCGCPPPVSLASSPATDTTFPLAESEGLAPPPAAPQKPIVPVGVTDAEVTVPLIYNAAHPPSPPPPSDAKTAPAADTASASAPPAGHGFFHRVGHFFAHIFG